jgi:predicted homoserine dehydrogenase-like protein
LQIASTIGRAVCFNDPTVAPLGAPKCEVIAVAKRNLKAGERVDGIGGFTVYGLIENTATCRAMAALPMGLAEGAVLTRDLERDAVLTTADVSMPAERLGDRLWAEQQRVFGAAQATREVAVAR